MSTLNEEVARLKAAKEAIKAKLIEKGVDIPENTSLDNYADLIGSIKTGKSFNKVGEITMGCNSESDIPIKILCDDNGNSLNSIYLKITNIDFDRSYPDTSSFGFVSACYSLVYDEYMIISWGYSAELHQIGYGYCLEDFLHNGSNYYGLLKLDINMSSNEEYAYVHLMNYDNPTILTVEYGYFE